MKTAIIFCLSSLVCLGASAGLLSSYSPATAFHTNDLYLVDSNTTGTTYQTHTITGSVLQQGLGSGMSATSATNLIGGGQNNNFTNVTLTGQGTWNGNNGGNSFQFNSTSNLTGPVIVHDTAPVAYTAVIGKTDSDLFEWALGIGNSQVQGAYGNRMYIATTPGPSGINTNNGGAGCDIVTSIEGFGNPFGHIGYWFHYNFATGGFEQDLLAPGLNPSTSGTSNGFGWSALNVNRFGSVSMTNGTTTISNLSVLGAAVVQYKDPASGIVTPASLVHSTVSYTISANLIPPGATYTNGTGIFSGLSIYGLPVNLSNATNYFLIVTNATENSECQLTDPTGSFSVVPSGLTPVLFNTSSYSNPFTLYDGNGTDLTGHPVTFALFAIFSAVTNTSISGNLTVNGNSTNTGALAVNGSLNVGGSSTLGNSVFTQAMIASNSVTTQHYSGRGTSPTIVTNSGAGGATGTVTLDASASDTAGLITLTTGSSAAVSATVFTLTFNTAFATAPHVLLTPASATAANLQPAQVLYTQSTTTTFTASSGSSGLVSGGTVYKWFYQVIQ